MSCSREINDFIAILSTKKTTKIMTQSDKCHALTFYSKCYCVTFLGHAFFNFEIFTQKKYKTCFKITLCLVLNLFKTEKKVKIFKIRN